MKLRSVLLVAGTALLAPLLAPSADASLPGTGNPWTGGDFLHIAHRGGGDEYPEHTLYAYAASLDDGVDMLEADIYETADGELVVLHDATVDRTTDGSGAVSSYTLDELKQLDAAYDFCPLGTTCIDDADFPFRGVATGARTPPAGFRAADFRIPTLTEALTDPRTTGIPFTIELKPDPDSTGAYEARLADVLAQTGRGDDVIVASFLDHNLELFKAFAPDVSTSFATAQAATFWASSQGPLPGRVARHDALQVPTSLGVEVVNADFVADADANDLAVHVWTINDCETMVELLGIGVDGIMTDRPSLLEAVVRATGPVDCDALD